MKSNEAEQWKIAMKSEMDSLTENNTYSIVPLPNGKKTVGSRWVFSLKEDPEGNVTHKARFLSERLFPNPWIRLRRDIFPYPKDDNNSFAHAIQYRV